ncbi:MAG: aspartate-semialdehyde dehydrogenase [Bdellovibrionota bacterium]|nr:aspartate-semialdehyde dehydrogenase [Pseudomonadota bacterium]MDY6090874.1 aspartate-semialdehyde dehydrogenase [Bdellovibrionota bacterium]
MKNDAVLAIVGATGLVGSEMQNVLNDLKLKFKDIKLLASENSVGELYEINGESYEVKLLTEDAFNGVDIALFGTKNELSEKFVKVASEKGVICIDNSSAFRMNEDVPLVVPEVNFDAIKSGQKIIANPNCSTIQMIPVLDAIEKEAGLERVVVSTYQSVSGAGKNALDELWSQTLAIFNQKEIEVESFLHQIAFNLIPQIDMIEEDGYSKEEYKMINETRKILNLPDLKITATCVRVPVFFSHAESINVQTKKEITPQRLIEILSKKEGIVVNDNVYEYPMPIDTAGENEIFVGRIRKDYSVPYGLNLWVVSDNIRKGAALNAVQIMQKLLENM